MKNEIERLVTNQRPIEDVNKHLFNEKKQLEEEQKTLKRKLEEEQMEAEENRSFKRMKFQDKLQAIVNVNTADEKVLHIVSENKGSQSIETVCYRKNAIRHHSHSYIKECKGKEEKKVGKR